MIQKEKRLKQHHFCWDQDQSSSNPGSSEMTSDFQKHETRGGGREYQRAPFYAEKKRSSILGNEDIERGCERKKKNFQPIQHLSCK